jgi:hypothetical protein
MSLITRGLGDSRLMTKGMGFIWTSIWIKVLALVSTALKVLQLNSK